MGRIARGALTLIMVTLLACSTSASGVAGQSPSNGSRASSAARQGGPETIVLRTFVRGLESPVGIVSAFDGSGRLFVIEQGGTIRVVVRGSLRERPFLDISRRITSGGEQGLLGLAFHPRYETTRRFYVNYTDNAGDTVIAEYKRSRRHPARARASSHRTVLTFDQPFANHNGGHLAFGPDGHLYIASGDGGSGGDPQGNGQRRDTLLGKILGIDVDARSGGRGYGIPEDNPFRDEAGAREEIWSYGLRNPWRFSFDRRNGAMWIGDVGQNQWEEIDYEAPSSEGGVNWGWNIKEGTRCFLTQTECAAAELDEDLTDPIAEYPHDFGCSVTGGFVYRGQRFPELRGFYFFADFCSGNIWTLDASNPTTQEEVLRLESDRSIASFGESASGELFVVDHAGSIADRR